MLRRHDDAVSNQGLGQARESGCKVNDEFAPGVGDDGQVGIGYLGDLGVQFQAQLVLGFGLVIVIVHCPLSFIFCKVNTIFFFMLHGENFVDNSRCFYLDKKGGFS